MAADWIPTPLSLIHIYEIDRLRHSATAALSERRDVIIVASVSCIYSLGDPIDYRSMVISLRPGMQMERDELCKKLVTLQYEDVYKRQRTVWVYISGICGRSWKPNPVRRSFCGRCGALACLLYTSRCV